MILVLFFTAFVFLKFKLKEDFEKSNRKSFKSKILYFAPKSKLKMQISTAGFVPDDSDFGYGKSEVKLFYENKNLDTVYLKTTPENIDSISYQGKKVAFLCDQMEKRKFYNYLVLIGFKNLNKNEIDELRDAMTLINYGSKATYLKGQTKFILCID